MKTVNELSQIINASPNTIRKYVAQHKDWTKTIAGVMRITEKGQQELTKIFGLIDQTEVINLSERSEAFYQTLIADLRNERQQSQHLLELKDRTLDDLRERLETQREEYHQKELEYLQETTRLSERLSEAQKQLQGIDDTKEALARSESALEASQLALSENKAQLSQIQEEASQELSEALLRLEQEQEASRQLAEQLQKEKERGFFARLFNK